MALFIGCGPERWVNLDHVAWAEVIPRNGVDLIQLFGPDGGKLGEVVSSVWQKYLDAQYDNQPRHIAREICQRAT